MELAVHFLFLAGCCWATVSTILEATAKKWISHHRRELRFICRMFIPGRSLKFQVLAVSSIFWWIIARKNLIMQLVHMGSIVRWACQIVDCSWCAYFGVLRILPTIYFKWCRRCFCNDGVQVLVR